MSETTYDDFTHVKFVILPNSILVVEDNHEVLAETVNILTEHGYDIIESEDGESALEYFGQSQVDIALIDVVLPKMTGLECAEEIKKISPRTKIILTSFARPEEFLEKHPDIPFIEKSYDFSLLPKKLRQILGPNSQTPA